MEALAAADPGFPVGGRQPIEGGTYLRDGCFSAETYAKMKELDPVRGGGVHACGPPDPPLFSNYR